MLASNSHYVVQPVVNGVNRFRYYATIDNNFPKLLNAITINAGGEARLTISVGFAFTGIIPGGTPLPGGGSTSGGTAVSRLWMTLSARSTQQIRLAVFLNNIDVSHYISGAVNIEWPDDSGGSGSLQLVAQNPFAVGATVNTEKIIDIFATLNDIATGELSTFRLFRGRVVQYDYTPDNDLTDISFQDMSRDVSHDTSRLNREILGVDPIVTEKITCTTANRITTSQNIDVNQPTPILGIWNETDTAFASNLIEQGDFTLSGGRTISFFQGGLLVAGRNYLVRYVIPLSQFTISTLKKSDVVQLIAALTEIDTVRLERTGFSEDEIVGVNITANNELPLDLIRKIVVPQTWKVEYNEFGELVVRREILKNNANADFTLNESIILDNTLKITKDIDSVINEIRVAGILKRLGRNTTTGIG